MPNKKQCVAISWLVVSLGLVAAVFNDLAQLLPAGHETLLSWAGYALVGVAVAAGLAAGPWVAILEAAFLAQAIAGMPKSVSSWPHEAQCLAVLLTLMFLATFFVKVARIAFRGDTNWSRFSSIEVAESVIAALRAPESATEAKDVR